MGTARNYDAIERCNSSPRRHRRYHEEDRRRATFSRVSLSKMLDGDRAASFPHDVKATHRAREIEKYKQAPRFTTDGSEHILTTIIYTPQVAEFRTSRSYFFSPTTSSRSSHYFFVYYACNSRYSTSRIESI